MKSKRKTPKSLCMIVSILFVTLIFVPNSKNHFLLAGIGISGLFLVIGSLILPAFPRLSRKLSYHRTKGHQKPWTWLKIQNRSLMLKSFSGGKLVIKLQISFKLPFRMPLGSFKNTPLWSSY